MQQQNLTPDLFFFFCGNQNHQHPLLISACVPICSAALASIRFKVFWSKTLLLLRQAEQNSSKSWNVFDIKWCSVDWMDAEMKKRLSGRRFNSFTVCWMWSEWLSLTEPRYSLTHLEITFSWPWQLEYCICEASNWTYSSLTSVPWGIDLVISRCKDVKTSS